MINIYQKGARKEYQIIKRLLLNGADIAQRTAGSRSPFDIIAIWKKDKIIKLIQSKNLKLGKEEYKKLKRDNEELSGCFHVSFEVE